MNLLSLYIDKSVEYFPTVDKSNRGEMFYVTAMVVNSKHGEKYSFLIKI